MKGHAAFGPGIRKANSLLIEGRYDLTAPQKLTGILFGIISSNSNYYSLFIQKEIDI